MPIEIIYNFSREHQSLVYAENILVHDIPRIRTVEATLCAATAVRFNFELWLDVNKVNFLRKKVKDKHPIGFTTLPDVFGLAAAPIGRYDSPYDYPKHVRQEIEKVLRFYQEMLDILFNRAISLFQPVGTKLLRKKMCITEIARGGYILVCPTSEETNTVLRGLLERVERGRFRKVRFAEQTLKLLAQYCVRKEEQELLMIPRKH